MIGRWEPVARDRLARTPGESINARLWRGCIGLWAPAVLKQGDKVQEWTAGGARMQGTLTNMTADDWVPSPLGWALDFDGSNDYLALPTLAATRLAPTTGITIFAVLQIASSVISREYITNASGGGAPAGFGFGISDAVNMQTKWYTGNGATGHNLQGGTTMTAGVWYAVAATFFPAASGTNKYTYLDGKVDQSAATATAMSFSGTSAAIFRYDAGASQYMPAKLPLIGVWNYGMPPQSIMQLTRDPLCMFRRRRVTLGYPATFNAALGCYDEPEQYFPRPTYVGI